MVDARVFALCGFFVERDFLAPADCARIRDEMAGASFESAGVVHEGEIVLDLGHRSTKRVGVEDGTSRLVAARFGEVRPRLECHFGVRLLGFQEPQFLRYACGDFFRRHADASDMDKSPDFLRERKVSTVIFLGHTGDECGERGGDLMFHDLLGDPRIRDRAFPFPAIAGTFLAFPSTVSHEVTTVTAGQRFSIATWFY